MIREFVKLKIDANKDAFAKDMQVFYKGEDISSCITEAEFVMVVTNKLTPKQLELLALGEKE